MEEQYVDDTDTRNKLLTPNLQLSTPSIKFEKVDYSNQNGTNMSQSSTRPLIYMPLKFNALEFRLQLYGSTPTRRQLRKFLRWFRKNGADYARAFNDGETQRYEASLRAQQLFDNANQKLIKPEQPVTVDTQPVATPEREAADWTNVQSVQNWLNTNFDSGLIADDLYGQNTNNAINTVLNDSNLTDEERVGLLTLQNSWENRMVGLKKKPLTPTLLQKPEMPSNQEQFGKYMYIPGNILLGLPMSTSLQNVNSESDSNWISEMTKKGYTQKYLSDGTSMFYDKKGNKYYNNGRMQSKGGMMHDYDFNTLQENSFLTMKKGGNILKYQQGGNMANKEQEIQQAFVAFLVEDAAAQGVQIKSEEDLKAYAQQLGEEGLQAKYQQFMQMMQSGVKAKLGAKLNYMRKIKGLCPDGEETYYFKEGGLVKRGCKPCMEKAEKGKKLEEEKMDPVKKFKCGRKVKKAMKGGSSELGLKGKINKYNDPNPKNPQKVLYDNYGNSVISEKGYFIKRKDLPNNKFKDDTIKSNDSRYNKIKLEFNSQK